MKSQFEALLAFKTDVQRFEEVFNVLDEDSNGRIDALEFIAAVAQCCKGSFDDKSRFCFELVDFICQWLFMFRRIGVDDAIMRHRAVKIYGRERNRR